MHTYTYAKVYVKAYVYVYVCIYIYRERERELKGFILIYIYMYTYVEAESYGLKHIHTHTHIYIYIYICIYIYIRLSIYIHICIFFTHLHLSCFGAQGLLVSPNLWGRMICIEELCIWFRAWGVKPGKYVHDSTAPKPGTFEALGSVSPNLGTSTTVVRIPYRTPLRDLLAAPASRAILDRRFPRLLKDGLLLGQGLGFRVLGLGFRFLPSYLGLLRAQGFGFRVCVAVRSGQFIPDNEALQCKCRNQ